MKSPLNKVVFIQRVASFAPLSLTKFVELAYVNNSWADTIKNYSSHSFEKLVSALPPVNDGSSAAWGWGQPTPFCEKIVKKILIKCQSMIWLFGALASSKAFFDRAKKTLLLIVQNSNKDSFNLMVDIAIGKIVAVGGRELLAAQLAVTDDDGRNAFMNFCILCADAGKFKFLMDKVVERGGRGLLRTQLSAIDRREDSCLLFVCGNKSSSLPILKLIVEKTADVGGTELLKERLSALTFYDGLTPLMQVCAQHPSSSEMINFLFDKIVEVGGTELLKSQLTATNKVGQNCLMLICSMCEPSSLRKMVKIFFAKSIEVGGKEILKAQFEAKDQYFRTCLMLLCAHCSSANAAQIVKRFLDTIVEVGGDAMLRVQLSMTNLQGLEKMQYDAGRGAKLVEESNVLAFVCQNQTFPIDVAKLIATTLYRLDIFQRRYDDLPNSCKQTLRDKAGIFAASWVPPRKAAAGGASVLDDDLEVVLEADLLVNDDPVVDFEEAPKKKKRRKKKKNVESSEADARKVDLVDSDIELFDDDTSTTHKKKEDTNTLVLEDSLFVSSAPPAQATTTTTISSSKPAEATALVLEDSLFVLPPVDKSTDPSALTLEFSL